MHSSRQSNVLLLTLYLHAPTDQHKAIDQKPSAAVLLHASRYLGRNNADATSRTSRFGLKQTLGRRSHTLDSSARMLLARLTSSHRARYSELHPKNAPTLLRRPLLCCTAAAATRQAPTTNPPRSAKQQKQPKPKPARAKPPPPSSTLINTLQAGELFDKVRGVQSRARADGGWRAAGIRSHWHPRVLASTHPPVLH